MSLNLLKRLLWQNSKTINCSVVAICVFVNLFVTVSPAHATSPKSANYQLNEWSIGGGGSDRSQSTNYKSEAITDPTAGDIAKSSNYEIGPGLIGTELANVPTAPSLTNPSEYYNKLHLVINNGNNPSDATFAVAISSDNFITTYYVKADNTIGSTLTTSDWRTYASWGSASGINIIGLAPKTTYQVKVKAEQGDFTESRWSTLASGATAETDDPKITFDIDTAATDTETDSPYIIAFGDLDAAVVNTATDKIWTDFGTNADNGGVVYIASLNQGLKSTASNHTIANASGTLVANTEGFGLVTNSITQTAGGPFTADNPFAGSGNTVGSAGITLVPLATSLAPITGGRNSVNVKAALNTLTPGGTDYTETLTLVAAATF